MTNTIPGSSDTSNSGSPTDYIKTLNVPKPDVKNPDGLDTNPGSIPQRAGLPRREPQIGHALRASNKNGR